MGTGHIVEAVDDKKGDGSSKHLKDNEVKPLSRHGSSASSSSSDSELDKSDQQPELKSFRVSFASSNGQSPDYVPNRIPSSIFSSKPTMDWSTASNESLFSIQVGNVSFSRDQFFMLYKSGELTKLDEQIIAQGNVLPSLKELEDMASRNENIVIEKGSGATEKPKNTTIAVESSKVAEGDSHQKTPPAEEVQKPAPTVDLGTVSGQEKKCPAEVKNLHTNSISGLSDESSNSTLSFAFPVLAGGTDAGRLSSANVADQNNKGLQQTQSVKQQEQQQQEKEQSTEELQPKTPVTPQNGSSRSWFSWFHCCRQS
ncbi:hypothetical protein PTKIN_Ptkin08bG0068000 [Pterospermum kingtungense]